MAFGELLAGYLSWLSIPLLGLGLSVGMIRSWRQGAGGVLPVLGKCEGGWADGEVINVDASGGPPQLSVITPGEKAGWAYLQPGLPQQDMTLPHDPPLSAVLSLRSDQPFINGPLCQTEILSCAALRAVFRQ